MFATAPSRTPLVLSSSQMRSPPSTDLNRWATLCLELTYEVLTYCLSGATLDVCTPGLYPWYLGHVCTLWRSFIFSPCFWDRFTFQARGLETITIGQLQRALELVQLCIERTKNHLFSFSFEAYDLEVSQSLYAIQILEALVVHADRWRAAYFKADLDYKNRSLKLKVVLCNFVRSKSVVSLSRFHISPPTSLKMRRILRACISPITTGFVGQT